jgi:hypothetical protein
LSGIAKHGPYYGVGDLDDDGKPDLLACPEMGTYHFFRRTALEHGRRASKLAFHGPSPVVSKFGTS